MHKTKFYLPKEEEDKQVPRGKQKKLEWSPVFVYEKTSSSNHPQEVRHKPSKLSSLAPTHTLHPCPHPPGRAYFCDYMPACVWVCEIVGWLLKHGRRGPDK
jgi:hypothetical protein